MLTSGSHKMLKILIEFIVFHINFFRLFNFFLFVPFDRFRLLLNRLKRLRLLTNEKSLYVRVCVCARASEGEGGLNNLVTSYCLF